jgi:DNA processing protein
MAADGSPRESFGGGPATGRPGAWPPGFVRSRADRDAALVLAHLDGLAPRTRHALAWSVGSASACLREIRAGTAGAEAVRAAAASVEPGRVRRALDSSGARAALPGDPEYPESLLDLPDPPVCLFIRGRAPATHPGPAVAVVGARRSSAYGREAAGELAAGVAAVGVAVVSGGARGIDAAAHRGALRAGAATTTVLGSGIDVAYPRSHRGLLEEIARSGTVVSEYPPGVPPRPWRFPARNRIIAGLSAAVVVVEGASGSGSLITAEFAMDLGREVLAVPGPITSPLSAVPHDLIRDGATLVRGAEDVLAVLGMAIPAVIDDRRRTDPAGSGPGLSDLEIRLLEAAAGGPATAEALAREAGIQPAEVLGALVSLELRGLLRSVGGRYEASGATAASGRR